MFNQQQITRALSLIEETARSHHYQDDDDYCPADGGNFDDTFNEGLESGHVDFARELMGILTTEAQ